MILFQQALKKPKKITQSMPITYRKESQSKFLTMPTTLKNISKLKFNTALLLFPMILFCVSANGNVLIKKYTYGALIRGGHDVHISKITENDDDYVTFVTGKKNDVKEDSIELSVALKVKELDSKVLATTTFKNNSYSDRYIFITNIPYNRDLRYPHYFYALCEDMFSIFTDDNIKLDFLGEGCLPENMEIDSWVKIAPQKEIVFTVILNGSYLFLPGEHNYRIKTADYLVVDKKWFSTGEINKKLFSIFDFNYPKCKLRKHSYLLQKETELCAADPWKKNSIEYFMTFHFREGDILPPGHKIKSNQITIKINGSKVRSFYEIPRNLRS